MTLQWTRSLSPARLNVLIADEHPMVRRCLESFTLQVLGKAHFLDARDGSSVFAQAADPTRAVSLALIDPKMPGMQGGAKLAELARAHPRIPLVIVSAAAAEEALRWLTTIPTAFAYVSKTGAAENLRPALEAAMERRKLPFAPDNEIGVMPTFLLTRRQREIGLLLREGFSNKAIAERLGLSEGTVKNHISRLLKELRARYLVNRIRNEACHESSSS